MSSSNTSSAPKGTAKRDSLRDIEVRIQKKWAEAKIFEANAASDGSEHYMGCFPYPYMNGALHLGHTFTLSKVEFACAFERLCGKNVLFPFGFHATGMPIKACADKLKAEMEEFGPDGPPEEPKSSEEKKSVPSEEKTPLEQEKAAGVGGTTDPRKVPLSKADKNVFHSKKSKVAQKKGAGKTQWSIMRELGIPNADIPKFVDPQYWLHFWPPRAQEDMQALGLGIDWRRSFITTDLNQYYDSFVRWQFNILKEQGKVRFGKRYTVYSPKDKQPCADHERASGEGVLPVEYTNIKLRVVAPYPEKLKHLADAGRQIFLLCATLRPETMYGQTNCWIKPDGDYGAFEGPNNEVYICTARAARNLAYQDALATSGQVNQLVSLDGTDLIGCPLKAPLTSYDVVYCLPMLNILPDKGTGIVTSVPSDAPHDLAAFNDLKRKQPLREKYGVKDEWILPFEPVPIIETPAYGRSSAEKVVAELKIQSQNDNDKLEQARELCYMEGFNKGIMLCGSDDIKGKPVKDVKPIVKEMLIAAGQAMDYAEPEAVVMSRTGELCVVALTDQWFLTYGDDNEWKAQVGAALKQMEFFSAETRKGFEFCLNWLRSWACSRSFGLGTVLPWDETVLIESLSDSTIYMAYYTFAHMFQKDINGSEPGSLGIKPEQLSQGVWDYIFLGKPYPSGCTIPQADLDKCRAEFQYWYPFNIRVSGKDLINNHLTFSLYNHAAIFPDKMPLAMRANGHVLLDGKKMSKSEGNFLTLRDGVEQFGADAMRLTLADAGDGLEDANFERENANAAILRLFTHLEWCRDMIEDPLRSGPFNFHDQVFTEQINKTVHEAKAHYQATNYRLAVVEGFYNFQSLRDAYRHQLDLLKIPMHKDVVMRYIDVQTRILAPITPHLSEHVWQLLGRTGFVVNAGWPQASSVTASVLQKASYLKGVIKSLQQKLELATKPKKGPAKKIIRGEIHVGREYHEHQKLVLKMLRDAVKDGQLPPLKELAPQLNKILPPEAKPRAKQLNAFMIQTVTDFAEGGVESLQESPPFEEVQFLKENLDLVQAVVGVPFTVDDVGGSVPFKPTVTYVEEP